MPATLYLGVIDQPYAHSSDGQTTGDVAQILEARYHVMEVFYETNEEAITKELVESLAATLEDLYAGSPLDRDPFAAGAEKLKARFDQFITLEQIADRGVPGVPTKAALGGRSSRFKSKKNPRGRRPSFVDTGLYLASFAAWVDTEA